MNLLGEGHSDFSISDMKNYDFSLTTSHYWHMTFSEYDGFIAK